MTHQLPCGLLSGYGCGELLVSADGRQDVHLSVWLRGHALLQIGTRTVRIGPHDALAMSLGDGVPDTRSTPCAQHVDLLLQRERLFELGGELGETFLEGLDRYCKPCVAAADADTLRTANELVAVLLTHESSHLLRDAKSLELLARMLTASRSPVSIRLTPAQRERVSHARDLLLADLANPPTVAQLARASGLNTFKLKQGFRSLYGHSIHAVYQYERMQKAWQLIESGHMDVSAAGHHVGYSNLSHFSDAFRRHFGLRPGELKRCVSRTC
ncbi:hypothetical protein RHOFW510R12_00135 [Rhodanobacter sp. FW510-R12]